MEGSGVCAVGWSLVIGALEWATATSLLCSMCLMISLLLPCNLWTDILATHYSALSCEILA